MSKNNKQQNTYTNKTNFVNNKNTPPKKQYSNKNNVKNTKTETLSSWLSSKYDMSYKTFSHKSK